MSCCCCCCSLFSLLCDHLVGSLISAEFYLGYSRQELVDVSWYQLLHWDFMREAQSKHRLSEISIIYQFDQSRWHSSTLPLGFSRMKFHFFFFVCVCVCVCVFQLPNRNRIDPASFSYVSSAGTEVGCGSTASCRSRILQMRVNNRSSSALIKSWGKLHQQSLKKKTVQEEPVDDDSTHW